MVETKQPLCGSDEELIVAVAAGDVIALRGLLERHGPALLRQALRITNDQGRAEDTVQEVFVKVWTHAGTFDTTRGAVGAWLHMICRARAIDQVRQIRARARRELAYPAPVATHVDAGDRLAQEDNRCAVRRALEQLSGPQRQMIELTYFAGLTYRAAAERLAIPEGTAKTHVRRALCTLRRSISCAAA